MTDLEITKLCAEAMGADSQHIVVSNGRGGYWTYWRPLEDDAQAMALVKKFLLSVLWTDRRLGSWLVRGWYEGKTGDLCEEAESDSLNRAICECVANMQASK